MTGKRQYGWRTLAEVAQEVYDEVLAIQRGEKPKPPSTGFREMDGFIGGLIPTLIIIGAQPGVGKSAVLAGMIHSLAKQCVPVGLFSLEDRASWLVWRLLAYESALPQLQLKNKGLSQEARAAIQYAVTEIQGYGSQIILDDRPALSPREVCASADQMIAEWGVRVILVDHLGELRYGKERGDRYDLEVGEGLSQLRNLANQRQVSVLCATQLRRESAVREQPALTDFANSAAIERQARVAIGLTRNSEEEIHAWILKNTGGKAKVMIRIPFKTNAAIALEER